MAMRDDAHQLIDTLTDEELPLALRLLRSLRSQSKGAASFKDLLRAMPPVGEDADFERGQDQGRAVTEWDT